MTVSNLFSLPPGAANSSRRASRISQPANERSSARNRMTGVVVDVVKDGVMAQVDLVCGPFRVVSLMSREAADELGLAPGVAATAVMKATTVVVERG